MFPSVTQLLIVLAVILLLFGASRLPKISGDIAKSIKSFKKGLNEDETPKNKEIENKSDDNK